jgi:hypothetical protein
MTEKAFEHPDTSQHDQGAPLTTFPLAVFLKNLRCVKTASSRCRLRIVISTMVVGSEQRVTRI